MKEAEAMLTALFENEDASTRKIRVAAVTREGNGSRDIPQGSYNACMVQTRFRSFWIDIVGSAPKASRILPVICGATSLHDFNVLLATAKKQNFG